MYLPRFLLVDGLAFVPLFFVFPCKAAKRIISNHEYSSLFSSCANVSGDF